MLSSLNAHVNIFGNINEEKLSHYKVTQVNFWFSLAKLDYALSKGVICYTYIIMTLWRLAHGSVASTVFKWLLVQATLWSLDVVCT